MELSAATLCMWPSSQFLIHLTVHPPNPYLSNLVNQDVGEDRVKGHTKVKTDDLLSDVGLVKTFIKLLL